jgi:DNA polymerase elongation subunit (family B)
MMLVFDTEIYKNYFLLSMMDITTGKIKHFEKHTYCVLDVQKIRNILATYTVISFNGNSFDIPIITAALDGYSNEKLKALCDEIIKSKRPSWAICKDHAIYPLKCDHIDLIEVAIGQSSLKLYGGRLHAPTLQDLPIPPDALISDSQRADIRAYCENDLQLTALLYKELEPQIKLRADMSIQYGMDLRSKSDAQIAETIITSELRKMTGNTYKKTTTKDGEVFAYLNPQIIKFQRQDLNELLDKLCQTDFQLSDKGAVAMPPWLRNTKITIGATSYQMGIGGLHSCEKSQYVRAEEGYMLADFDVASYYPSIILQQRLAPKSMGEPFLKVYQQLVTRRIAAKKAKDTVTADVLKIAVNGSFGKLGSKYSALFAPDLLIQTTITGQLALLMLIEAIEETGARVVSANTDGVVVYCSKRLESQVEAACWDWMLQTSYELERTDYSVIASRDVNAYVAVKLDGKTKGKGLFARESLAKNPDYQIIANAVAAFIAKAIPLEATIRGCTDIRQFISIRKVTGGATWRGEHLGRAVRFYASADIPQTEYISYATNSNKVPNSAGARPLMTYPDQLPSDIDYRYYITEAEKLLCEVGYR